jgi:hypothetical protein
VFPASSGVALAGWQVQGFSAAASEQHLAAVTTAVAQLLGAKMICINHTAHLMDWEAADSAQQ